MELADILPRGAVVVCDKVSDKTALLEILSERAANLTGLKADAVLDALSSRELLGSTGLGNGIAIPHGKCAGLKSVLAIFCRLGHSIEFDAVDDQPVDLVIMLLAPLNAGADHLKALARAARLLRTESLVEQLRATNDPDRLYDILTTQLTARNAA